MTAVLEKVFKEIKLRAVKEYGDSLLLIIVFGSATRIEDFVPELSDVDVLLVVDDDCPLERIRFSEYYSLESVKVSLITMRKSEFEESANIGTPLSHWAKLDSRMLYYSSPNVIKWFESIEPRLTDYTVSVFRRSAVVAYGIAAEYFFMNVWRRVLHHLYHSIRHALRYRSSLELRVVPASNREVKLMAKKLKLHEAVELFEELVRVRARRKASFEVANRAMDRASIILSDLLNVKFPRWLHMHSLLKLLDEVSAISYEIEDDRVRANALVWIKSRGFVRVRL